MCGVAGAAAVGAGDGATAVGAGDAVGAIGIPVAADGKVAKLPVSSPGPRAAFCVGLSEGPEAGVDAASV